MTGAIYVAGALDYETRKRVSKTLVSYLKFHIYRTMHISGDNDRFWFLAFVRRFSQFFFDFCCLAMSFLREEIDFSSEDFHPCRKHLRK